jgi:hypothetical protein
MVLFLLSVQRDRQFWGRAEIAQKYEFERFQGKKGGVMNGTKELNREHDIEAKPTRVRFSIIVLTFLSVVIAYMDRVNISVASVL